MDLNMNNKLHCILFLNFLFLPNLLCCCQHFAAAPSVTNFSFSLEFSTLHYYFCCAASLHFTNKF